MHTPTGRLQLSAMKRGQILLLLLSSELKKLLVFSQDIDMFYPEETYTADEPHRLAVYRDICVHLAEVSYSDNLHNRLPSTLLRCVPVENERCWSGRTETFPVLQYKRLSSGPVLQLTISLRDTNGKKSKLRSPERDVAYQKWLMRQALGASENALGWLWLTLG